MVLLKARIYIEAQVFSVFLILALKIYDMCS